MELQPGTIKNLQGHIAAKIKERGFEDENIHERLLLLVEEVGELVKSCRKMTGMNVNQASENKYNVGEEVADIINLIFAVGIKLGLNIEDEFVKKNALIDTRAYKRATGTP